MKERAQTTDLVEEIVFVKFFASRRIPNRHSVSKGETDITDADIIKIDEV